MKYLERIIQEEYQKILQEQRTVTKILPLSPGELRKAKKDKNLKAGFRLVRKQRGSNMTNRDIISSIEQSSQFGATSGYAQGQYKYIIGEPLRDRKGKIVVNVLIAKIQDDDPTDSDYYVQNSIALFPNEQTNTDQRSVAIVDKDTIIDKEDGDEEIDNNLDNQSSDDFVTGSVEKIQSFDASSTYGIAGAKAGGINDNWGGTMGKLLGLFAFLKKKFPSIKISSLKRDKRNTKSGNRSDHWSGSEDSYGVDIAGFDEVTGNEIGDTIGDQVFLTSMKSIGHKPVTKGGAFNKTVDDIRYQILWRTNIGGNHYNHVHIGARNESLDFDSNKGVYGKENVTLAQTGLKKLGYDLGTFGPNKDGIDGKYGPVTRKAIKDFQKDNNLNQTGDLNVPTINALREKLAKLKAVPTNNTNNILGIDINTDDETNNNNTNNILGIDIDTNDETNTDDETNTNDEPLTDDEYLQQVMDVINNL